MGLPADPVRLPTSLATSPATKPQRRYSGGGNGGLNKLILLPLIKSRYDVRGRLYVPKIPAAMSFADYEAGQDPVLGAAIAHR